MGRPRDAELIDVGLEDLPGGLDKGPLKIASGLQGSGEREHGGTGKETHDQFTHAELGVGVERFDRVDQLQVELFQERGVASLYVGARGLVQGRFLSGGSSRDRSIAR